MEFSKLVEGALANCDRYGKKHGIDLNEDFAILKLGEEYGEFIQAYMIQKKLCRPEKIRSDAEAKEEVGKELADIIGSTMLVAHHLNVDLETELRKKWLKEIIPNEQ